MNLITRSLAIVVPALAAITAGVALGSVWAQSGDVAKANPQAHVDAYGDALPPKALFRLGTIRFRPTGQVVALAWTGDGTSL
jgi:hypothetical protein